MHASPWVQVDIRSYSGEAVHGEKSLLPLMICLLLLSVLGIVLSVMTAISNCPNVATTSIDWVTGPPIRRVGFRCRRTELSESQLQNDHVL